MKKKFFGLLSLLAFSSQAQEPLLDYVIFSNSQMKDNYFFSKVYASGGSAIIASAGRLPVTDSRFHTPGNCLQLAFRGKAGGQWKAVVFRALVRGQDHFRDPNYLSLYLLAASGRNAVLPKLQLMFSDSSLSENLSYQLPAGPGWQRIWIPLTDLRGKRPQRATDILGLVFSQSDTNTRPARYYIDDIEITDTKGEYTLRTPVLTNVKGYAKHIDLSWPSVQDTAVKYVQVFRSEDGKEYQPVRIEVPWYGRCSDYTGKTGKTYYYRIAYLDRNYARSPLSAPRSASTRPMSTDEMLTMVQEASFRYYWEGAEPNSGLARENLPGRRNMIATGASGFGLMALLVGAERGFESREAIARRFVQILDFLEKAQTFHGAYPHFADGITGQVDAFFGRKDNGADLVETSFLFQGLLAARNYFDGTNGEEQAIRQRITSLWQKVEWDWFRKTPDSKFLYWHWSPDQGWIINHNLIGWNETMVTYLLAIASPTHPVPASMYYSGWANQDSTGIKYRTAWGGTTAGSHYTNGNKYENIRLDVGVSSGGPLFFTHYSYLGYDPHRITDAYTNYYDNNRNIALINLRYCLRNPHGYPGYSDSCWGLTASDGPYDYSADEPVASRDPGKIAPTGAISSFPYTPRSSVKALRNYYDSYGRFLWGSFGFKDAFSLKDNWCSELYMGLNQAPMAVMIENYRTGLLWKLLAKDPDVNKGLQLLNEETARQRK